MVVLRSIMVTVLGLSASMVLRAPHFLIRIVANLLLICERAGAVKEHVPRRNDQEDRQTSLDGLSRTTSSHPDILP